MTRCPTCLSRSKTVVFCSLTCFFRSVPPSFPSRLWSNALMPKSTSTRYQLLDSPRSKRSLESAGQNGTQKLSNILAPPADPKKREKQKGCKTLNKQDLIPQQLKHRVWLATLAVDSTAVYDVSGRGAGTLG